MYKAMRTSSSTTDGRQQLFDGATTTSSFTAEQQQQQPPSRHSSFLSAITTSRQRQHHQTKMSNENAMKIQNFLISLQQQVDDELLEFLVQLLDQQQQQLIDDKTQTTKEEEDDPASLSTTLLFDDQDPEQLMKILEGIEIYNSHMQEEVEKCQERTIQLENTLATQEARLHEAENATPIPPLSEEDQRLKVDVVSSRQALSDLTQEVKQMEQDVYLLQQRLGDIEQLNDDLADERNFHQQKVNELELIMNLATKKEILAHLEQKALDMEELGTEVRDLEIKLNSSRQQLAELQEAREIHQAKVVELSHVYTLSEGIQHTTPPQQPGDGADLASMPSSSNLLQQQEQQDSSAAISKDQAVELMVMNLRSKVEALEEERQQHSATIVDLMDQVACKTTENQARATTITQLEKHLKQLQQPGGGTSAILAERKAALGSFLKWSKNAIKRGSVEAADHFLSASRNTFIGDNSKHSTTSTALDGGSMTSGQRRMSWFASLRNRGANSAPPVEVSAPVDAINVETKRQRSIGSIWSSSNHNNNNNNNNNSQSSKKMTTSSATSVSNHSDDDGSITNSTLTREDDTGSQASGVDVAASNIPSKPWLKKSDTTPNASQHGDGGSLRSRDGGNLVSGDEGSLP